MILKDTILSAFTDRGTLLKWLKKVETALHDSTLTDISIDQISETQVKLKFTFENGAFVESPVLTLPRGEKGDKGDKGDTGATPNISVTATELPAGSSPTATRSGTNENPLITFGIPSGTQLYYHDLSFGDKSLRVLSKDNEVYTALRLNLILKRAIIKEYSMERFLVLSLTTGGVGKISFVYLNGTDISTSPVFTTDTTPDSDTVTPL